MLERELINLLPLVIIVGSILIIILLNTLYKIARLIFAKGEEPAKKAKQRRRKVDPEFDNKTMDEVLERASELKHRVQVLEEIIAADREQQQEADPVGR